MKCICGYENKHGEWDPGEWKVAKTPEKKKFIRVFGTFLVENTSWEGGKHEVSLYACPECGTVQMKD